MSPRRTLLVLVVYATSAAITGLLLEGIPEYLSLACYFLLFIGHCLFVVKSESFSLLQVTSSHDKLSAEG